MRIMYQNGEVFLSLTRDEVDHIYENKGQPVALGIRTLKVLHEDVSKAVLHHWSNVEVWDAIEEHLESHKRKD
jgi:hypothetical protein